MTQRRRFGSVRKLPSGRWQAHVVRDGTKLRAPTTFETRIDAEGWLRRVQAGDHLPAKAERTRATFGEYAERWLEQRDLKPRTRAHYRALLESRLLPALADVPLRDLTPTLVRSWYVQQDPSKPTMRAHAYALLRTILSTAVADELVESNPCRIRGAGSAKRARNIRPATLTELEDLVQAMPERHRVMTLLAAWLGLRYGELAELRRQDLDLDRGVVRVRRGVVWTGGQAIVGTPKSSAGARDVAIPPHLSNVLRDHLDRFAQPGDGGLLFPAAGGGHLHPTTLHRPFHKARVSVGRPDLRWYDLRHTGAVLAASAGATLAELMNRLGHTTAAVAMRYQHVAQDRDAAIAKALSELAGTRGRQAPV